ncbi:MAG: PilZ domain-containing protein [Rhodospirillales bacterium]|nr:PilZ domain-containing protein [Rhodospirillales bacterium]
MNKPSSPSDIREFERKDVLFAANLLIGEIKAEAEIINISFGGAQVRIHRSVEARSDVTLEIDPFGSFIMEVRWSDGKDVGLKFNDDSVKVAELVMAIATYA